MCEQKQKQQVVIINQHKKEIERRAVNKYKIQESLKEARHALSGFQAISFNPDTKELLTSQKRMEDSIRALTNCIELLLVELYE